MRSKMLAVGLASLLLAALPVAAQEAVTFDLRSAANGGSVSPGDPVTWEIWVEVTTTNNQGLALVAVDLVQDPGNTVKFDIPPAAGVPAIMDDFSRPDGISNPGEDGAPSGYIGVQRGAVGEMNLIQIGGGQNTFGAPGQGGVGEDENVDSGIGLSGPVMIATGSFIAPATEATYAFAVQNALANVLDAVNPPPAFSPVSQATVTYVNQTITFDVSEGRLGDMDCDGDVDFDDINPFVLALSGEAAYLAEYPDCRWLNADCDEDGDVDFDDINPFVGLIGT